MFILAINPGSTSTKIGLFDDHAKLFEKVLRHSADELAPFDQVADQYEFRRAKITEALAEHDFELARLDAIACRGGVCKPISGGTFLVDEEVCEDQRSTPLQHPASLASIIGLELANMLGIKAYFTDAPMTYEMSELAAISGHREIKRHGRFHALNSKAIAHLHAKQAGLSYQNMNLLVCHMGGGITVSMHEKGLAIDATDAVAEGPMSPERSGCLPSRDLVDLCFSGEFTYSEVKKALQGQGGLYSYLGTADIEDVERMIAEGNEQAKLHLDAMIYQVAKQIGSMATVVNGKVDAILLTGGIAYSKYVTAALTERCEFIADISVYPGEVELEALVSGVLRVTDGTEAVKHYADHIVDV